MSDSPTISQTCPYGSMTPRTFDHLYARGLTFLQIFHLHVHVLIHPFDFKNMTTVRQLQEPCIFFVLAAEKYFCQLLFVANQALPWA